MTTQGLCRNPPWCMGNQLHKTITINNGSNSNTLTNYQISVTISFVSGMNADFSDIWFSGADGTRLSHWIESKTNSTSAVFWVKVLTIPASGSTTVVMYYGNIANGSSSSGASTFDLFDDYDLSVTQEIVVSSNAATYSLSSSATIAAENIVFDSVTNKYWWIFEDRSGASFTIKLASSSSMSGPWTMEGSPVISETGHDCCSPFLMNDGAYWYIFYGRTDSTGADGTDMWIQKSSTVNSGYSTAGITNPILSRGSAGTWEQNRVLEPYVIQANGTYYMFYMGESVTPSKIEKVGYATSTSLASGWSKYNLNPVLGNDSPCGWNVGRVKAADPYVIKNGDYYYVGVNAGSSNDTGSIQGVIGFYKTLDFITFVECNGNPVLHYSLPGNWDDQSILRGSIQQFGGVYYMTYSGSHSGFVYKMGITTVSFNQSVNIIDRTIWPAYTLPAYSLWATISSSIVTIPLNGLISSATFGTNHAVRVRAKMNSPGSSWVGFRNGNDTPLVDVYSSSNIEAGATASTAGVATSSFEAPGNFRTFDIIRNGSTSTIYYMDGTNKGSLTTQITTINMPASLYNLTNNGGNNLQVDRVMVRKYSSPEPSISIS